MKAPKRILMLTPQEHRLLIQGLIELRNELIKEGECSNLFDDLLIKIHNAKIRRKILVWRRMIKTDDIQK